MKNYSTFEQLRHESKDLLFDVLRAGARSMLQKAIEIEVAAYIEQFQKERDENGRRLVVRNGHLPQREVLTGLGPIAVKQPRVRDKRDGCKFTSAILPPFVRKARNIEATIASLYLHGVSTNDFSEALEALLGSKAKGLSATTISRITQGWQEEFSQWQKRELSKKKYVYWWVDGVYFKVRLTEDRPCVLVIIGALENGEKEVVAIVDGVRESTLSWKEVLLDLKNRGCSAPKLAIGDGAMGFWAALEEIYPDVQSQRCWVHKTANVLDKLPTSVQSQAKRMLHDIYMAPTKEKGEQAFNAFLKAFEGKYPKSCECLKKDREVLMSFYSYPEKHWQHIRSTNPIESTFATLRHRSRQTKGNGSRCATLGMVYKLMQKAQESWRKLRGYEELSKVIQGVRFKDGKEEKNSKEEDVA